MKEILRLVEEYINKKHESKKWEAGKDWVQYAGPFFSSKEYVAAIQSLLNEWLVLGSDAQTFETIFPKLVNKQYGILTNSGSSANLIMMSCMKSKRLHNFPKGTKVITPVAGFPTTVNPIIQCGYEPFFVDIDIDTLNLNLEQVLVAAHQGAKIITFAHVLGNPPNMNELIHIIKKYNLVLLEDCCDALGSKYDGKPLGSFGEMSSFSFYPAHHMTIGEGGFVAFDGKLQEKVARSFREWGRGCFCNGKAANLLKNGTCKKRFSNWLPELPNEIIDHKYVYDEIGYNLKPIELQASIGLVQMEKLPEIHTKRKENHNNLYKIFKPYEEFFILPKATINSDPSWFAFAVTIKKTSPFKRESIVQFFENKKIQTRQYFAGNMLLHPAYDDYKIPFNSAALYPNATMATTNTFFLGVSPVITIEQIDYIKICLDEFMSMYTKKEL